MRLVKTKKTYVSKRVLGFIKIQEPFLILWWIYFIRTMAIILLIVLSAIVNSKRESFMTKIISSFVVSQISLSETFWKLLPCLQIHWIVRRLIHLAIGVIPILVNNFFDVITFEHHRTSDTPQMPEIMPVPIFIKFPGRSRCLNRCGLGTDIYSDTSLSLASNHN